MSFLQPAYLWALTALTVPLAIHLLSRKEGKVLRMGSLRHVRETPTRQFKSIRLNEYLLLVLRMILLGLLTFLLAGWYLENLKDHSKWLVMEPGLEGRTDLKPWYDSLEAVGYERRLLQPGFPEAIAVDPLPRDYSARLEELARLPVEEVVVVATNRLSGFRGPLVSMPEHVTWFVVDELPAETEVDRVILGDNLVQTRTGSFDAGATIYKSSRTSNREGRARDTVRVMVAFEPEFETDKATLHAVLVAIKNEAADALVVATTPSASLSATSTDWLIWLSRTPPPVSDARLIYFGEAPGQPMLLQDGSSRYRLTMRLNSEVVTSENLAVHLMKLLLHNPKASTTASLSDLRVLPMQMAFNDGAAAVRPSSLYPGEKSSFGYLLTALVCVIVLERLLASRNKQ